MTELRDTTTFGKYIPCLSFKYICKTNRFIYHKKELLGKLTTELNIFFELVKSLISEFFK